MSIACEGGSLKPNHINEIILYACCDSRRDNCEYSIIIEGTNNYNGICLCMYNKRKSGEMARGGESYGV